MSKIESATALTALRDEINAKPSAPRTVVVATGTCGNARGASEVVEAVRQQIEEQGVADKVDIRVTGCQGFCQAEPVVMMLPERTFYSQVKARDAADIVSSASNGGAPVERILFKDGDESFVKEDDVPFFRNQNRLLMGQHVNLDPTSIDDYIAQGGYQAAATAITSMGQMDIINEVKEADLRGRGGGGFQAARKWESTYKATGSPKYVLCNADEGDPGAYMDRSLLEGNPHSVLEGMIIGAYAIGSTQGYIYARAEYPMAVDHMQQALDQAEEYGLLGDNLFGTDFCFRIKVVKGGGAFVCGESTALMASIEGRAGEPRAKYVHTSDYGLYDKPSNLNNVETWANVPLVINMGAEKYASIGAEGGRGTKIFSLVGKIKNTGLVEVELGATLRDIIYDIGGGILDDKEFKSVQTGGPSGGCLRAEHLDLGIDFDSLWDAGSMMGSGGMIVMDNSTCMVDLARYFIDFLMEESCGKCAPCREGLFHMSEILHRIVEGEGKEGDIELLEELSETVQVASLCGLGQSAPNPIVSTLRYFRDEYEQHIREKKCIAGACKALVEYSINENCTGCTACSRVCPVDAIEGEKKGMHTLDKEKCIKCGACDAACNFDAVVVQ